MFHRLDIVLSLVGPVELNRNIRIIIIPIKHLSLLNMTGFVNSIIKSQTG